MQVVDTRRLGLWAFVFASLLGCVLFAPAAGAAPGSYTQAQVDASIAAGVANIDAQQNPDGSFGSSFPVGETGAALGSYGVMANGNIFTLPDSYQHHVQQGIAYLLNEQDATSGGWLGYNTYYTGLALIGLSFFKDQPGVQTSIDKGRAYLVANQNAPPNFSCDPNGANYDICGGWGYNQSDLGGWSDASNTGFAMTGLELTGGVAPANVGANIGWQRNVQEISSNPHATLNNGGGSYSPGETYEPFRSNANDTGSLLFGFAYDGVAEGDGGVQAAKNAANQFLNEYEFSLPNRTMLAYSGTILGPTCALGGTCDWFESGDGGYHYSIFALSKGIGQYESASLTDGNNFYAKVVDLLLGEQAPDGSWPPDYRDDGSPLMASSFAILSLGKVGQKPPPPPAPVAPAAKPTASSSIKGPTKCTRSTATVRVSGQNISTVAYSLDGKKIKTAKGNKTSVKVNLRHKKSGVHRVSAKVTYTSATAAAAQTKRFTVSRCARQAAKPKFTG